VAATLPALEKLHALNSNNNYMMKKLLLFCLPFATTMALAQTTDEAAKYAALITQEALKAKLTILASADMEGRETATPGQKKAAAWIEEQFKSFGLKPGNGDSYQQLYPVYQAMLSEKKLSVNGKNFDWDKDFSFGLLSGSWKYNNIVFAGYGEYDSAKNVNDYAGLDVKGKIVMVLEGGVLPAPTQGQGRGGGAAFAKANNARRNGAAGLLIVSADFPKKTATNVKGRMSITPPSAITTAAPATAPFFSASISDAVASALLGRTANIGLAELKNTKKGTYVSELSATAGMTTETLESSNVIGIIPGTSKKDEYVFFTSHYDHIGRNGNVIYYGADDDGSGSVGVIQMAEAFAAAAKAGNKPKRTLIFMTVSGEEKGLLGSAYYADHPTVDLAKASVDLNTDMIGRGDDSRKGDTMNYIYVIGHDKLSSELQGINEGVNNKYIKNLALDYKYDDPKDPNRIYYRSDHYNFAKKGVPILFFYDGMLGPDYHGAGDTVDKIHFEVMSRRTQLVFHTGWVIANKDELLKRDIPLTMPAR
jgi:Zn-dependent M28 family amino/carboxypeptidase